MVAAGGLDEARALLERGLDPGLPAMKAVGRARIGRDICAASSRSPPPFAAAQQATRRYAKRQLTWFRHQSAAALTCDAQYSESFLHRSRHFIDRFLLTGRPDLVICTPPRRPSVGAAVRYRVRRGTCRPSRSVGAEIVIKALRRSGRRCRVRLSWRRGPADLRCAVQTERLRHVLVRQERRRGARRRGLCALDRQGRRRAGDSGPGATNAVTGLTDALMDSVPMVCLTGQVPTHLIGNDAFQEADTTGITRPCTKHNYLVPRRQRTARGRCTRRSTSRASGRPGPVVVDLPKDMLFATRPLSPGRRRSHHRSYRPQTRPDRGAIDARSR